MGEISTREEGKRSENIIENIKKNKYLTNGDEQKMKQEEYDKQNRIGRGLYETFWTDLQLSRQA